MIIGIDIGGTKTHVVVESERGTDLERVVPSASWRRGGLLDELAIDGSSPNVTRLLAMAHASAGASEAALVIGAHGLDSERERNDLHERVRDRHSGPTVVVNDAELIAPAAGLPGAIAVVAGTGSKVVGHDERGRVIAAGGWGHVLGDPGSAPAITRDAVRALLARRDRRGEPDALTDALCMHFGCADLVGLAARLTDHPHSESWGSACPVVFDAADVGSSVAREVLASAARELADTVALVQAGGAASSDVVLAGGVLVNQPEFAATVASEIRALSPGLHVHTLTSAPVAGALALARSLELPQPAHSIRRTI